eukprot:7378040-Prymnesium_polylepis.1
MPVNARRTVGKGVDDCPRLPCSPGPSTPPLAGGRLFSFLRHAAFSSSGSRRLSSHSVDDVDGARISSQLR